MNAQQARNNAKLLYIFSFAWMFIPTIPILVPYFSEKGLSMQEFLELQAMFGLAVAILEVPSGYIADLWGRKIALVIAAVASGVGFTSLVYCDTYWEFFAFEMSLAVAISMVSGADFSLLYDSISRAHKDDRESLQKAVANRFALELSAESVSAVLGGVLAAISLSLIVVVNAFLAWIPLILLMFIKEVPIERMDSKSHWSNVKEISKHIFASDRLLRMIFLNFVLWSLATFCAVWLLQKHWQSENISIASFGFIWAALQMTAAISGKIALRAESKLGTKKILLITSLLPTIGYLGLGLTGAIGAVGFAFTFYVSRGLTQVVFAEALNWRVPSQFRAVANSMVSLGMRLLFFVVGPIIGLIIDRYNTKIAALGLAGLYALLFFVMLLPMVHYLRKTDSEES